MVAGPSVPGAFEPWTDAPHAGAGDRDRQLQKFAVASNVRRPRPGPRPPPPARAPVERSSQTNLPWQPAACMLGDEAAGAPGAGSQLSFKNPEDETAATKSRCPPNSDRVLQLLQRCGTAVRRPA